MRQTGHVRLRHATGNENKGGSREQNGMLFLKCFKSVAKK